MNKSILILPLIILWGCTHPFDDVKDNTPVGNFEMLWKSIDEKYCFVEEKQIDWQLVHDTILPKIKQLDQADYLGLFDTMESMLNLLEDGHVNLYTPFDISSCSQWYDNYPTNFDWDIIKRNYLNQSRRAGGAQYQLIADNQVGYLYCESFSTAITPANMAYILRSFKECKGMIIDVRNNGGGDMENAKSLAATFFSETRQVGWWQHKSGPKHNDFSPLEEMRISHKDMPSKWLRPVIVLCNRRSYSAANFFVSAMRYADNCLIVGGISGGGGGMPMSYELPNGWIVRFSSIRMLDKEQNSIEPGVKPHILVNQESSDTDDLIDKSVNIILSLYD